MNDRQGGDPGKLAGALVQLASQQEPPSRFVAGADAIAGVEQKAHQHGATLPPPALAGRRARSHVRIPVSGLAARSAESADDFGQRGNGPVDHRVLDVAVADQEPRVQRLGLELHLV